MVYQLIWMRKLELIFGNTTFATSSILTAFMGGLALGSYLFGKKGDRTENPLKLYAWLEFGIGISAIVILYLFLPISDAIYRVIFNVLGNQPVIFNVIRFVLSLIILIVPTTLMGGTLPVISKFFIRRSDEFGNKLGKLYGINTFGAVLGAFLTGFFMIRWWGVTTTVWIAILTNFIVAGCALWINNKFAFSDKEVKQKKAEAGKSEKQDSGKADQIRAYPARTAKLAFLLFGIAGFTSLAYEVVWTRALIFFISSTTYSFTIILTTFLIGITLGSLIISRRVDKIRNLIFWFSLLEVVIAVFALATIPLLKNLTSIQAFFSKFLELQNWTQVSVLLYLSAGAILLIPTLAMGALFPIVNRIYVENVRTVSKGVGNVYMVNTIGAILGAFLAGFVLLPLLGMNYSILFLAAINLAIGMVIIFFERDFHKKYFKFLPLPGAALVLFLAIFAFGFSADPVFLKTGGFQGTRLLEYKDTAAGTISVLEKKDQINIWGRNVRYLNVNGHNTAHTTFSDMIIHKMLAHLPMLLHPEPRKALVIGFGFGNTSHSFLQYSEIEKVDCVELVAYEKKTAKYFVEENKGIFEDPRFHFIVNDGRNFALATKETYDIISVNSVDPKFSPTLYTVEFYQLCRDRLNDNGEFVAWLPIYGMSLREVQSLVRSFIKVFPEASLWYNNPEHLLLLGQKTKNTFDARNILKRLSEETVKGSLAEIHLAKPYSFLATFFCGPDKLNRFAGDAPAHSDERPIVEFSQVPTREMNPDVYEELLSLRESILPYCENLDAFGEIESVKRDIMANEKATKNLIAGFFSYRLLGEKEEYQDIVSKTLDKMRKSLDAVPENDFNVISYVDLINHTDLDTNKVYFERAVEAEKKFAKAYVYLALERSEENDWAGAMKFYQKAVELSPRYLTALMNYSLVCAKLKEWEKAKELLIRFIELDPENGFAHSGLGQIYYMLQDYDGAIAHTEAAIRYQPEMPNYYFNLGMMYEKQRRYREAIEVFKKGIELAPYDQRARNKLKELEKLKKISK